MYAIPGYSGSRTVSLLKLTWIALSNVRWLAGSRPVSCPSPGGLSRALLRPDGRGVRHGGNHGGEHRRQGCRRGGDR